MFVENSKSSCSNNIPPRNRSYQGVVPPPSGSSPMTCSWANTTIGPRRAASFRACVGPPGTDVLSDFVRRGGWPDCRQLPGLWQTSIPKQSGQFQVYLEVGANLGACVFEMLFSVPDALIVAFEPQPVNVFRLTSTLSQLNYSLRKRVVVFPVALGSVDKLFDKRDFGKIICYFY